MNKAIAIIKGDGIGPEIVPEPMGSLGAVEVWPHLHLRRRADGRQRHR